MPEPDSIRSAITRCVQSGYEASTLIALADALDRRLSAESEARLSAMSEALGMDVRRLSPGLRLASDSDEREAAARQIAASCGGCACSGDPPPEPGIEERNDAVERLGKRAVAPLIHLTGHGWI